MRRLELGRRIPLVGIAAVAVVLLGSALAASRLPAAPPQASGDALTRLRAGGTIRIAVPDAAPQTTDAGGARTGFDVDVGRAIAQELRLAPSIVPVGPDAPVPDDVSLSLGPAGADQGTGTTDVRCASWPTLLAVPVGRAPLTSDAQSSGALG